MGEVDHDTHKIEDTNRSAAHEEHQQRQAGKRDKYNEYIEQNQRMLQQLSSGDLKDCTVANFAVVDQTIHDALKIFIKVRLYPTTQAPKNAQVKVCGKKGRPDPATGAYPPQCTITQAHSLREQPVLLRPVP